MGKTLYNISDLPEDYPTIIREKMKDEGASIKEVISELGLSAVAHAKFMKEDAAYKEAIEQGKEDAEAWWMTQGRKNLENKGFNVGIYAFQMKNRFKWRDTPLIVNGNDAGKLDKYKKEEILSEFKKEDSNEKTVN